MLETNSPITKSRWEKKSGDLIYLEPPRSFIVIYPLVIKPCNRTNLLQKWRFRAGKIVHGTCSIATFDYQRLTGAKRREWMAMGVAGMIILSYCGSFSHSPRLAPLRRVPILTSQHQLIPSKTCCRDDHPRQSSASRTPWNQRQRQHWPKMPGSNPMWHMP